MLVRIGRQVLDTWNEPSKDDLAVNQFCETCLPSVETFAKAAAERIFELTWYLSRSSGPHLRLVVLQEPYKRANQLLTHDTLSNSLGQPNKFVRNHIPHAPALVVHARAQRVEEVIFGLGRGKILREGNEVGDGK